MNAYQMHQMKFMAFPSISLVPVNNTTKKIQNYQFNMNQILGKGNFSTVYRGVNELNNQPVAIKVVQLSSIQTPALLDLLYSEIEILKTLNHPNIMKCFEVFTSANNCYIITELCSDGDLQTRIRSRGPIPERQANKIVYEIFQGLKYLADQGIVHRDFKIANILFNNGVAKIADFGFAKRTRDRFKDINVGSPIYMSPEGLIDNVYGPKTDIWAFGVFVFEILHGDTPLAFCQSEADLKLHICNPLRLESFHPSISRDLRELMLRCLEVQENRRISIPEIDQSAYMRRIARELGHNKSLEKNMNTNSQGKLIGIQGSPGHMQFQRANMLLPPRAVTVQNKVLIAENSRNNSPRGLIGDQIKKKNQSFQNIHIDPKRGASNDRPNYHHNLHHAPPSTNASFSQDARNRTNSLQHLAIKQPGYVNQNCKIIGRGTIINFYECVGLLHYCRLSFKVTSQLIKIQQCVGNQIKEYFINWLLQVFQEVQAKIPSQIRFEGQKAALKEQKLKDVIQEYHKKYYNQLCISTPIDTTLGSIQQTIVNLLKFLDQKIAQPQNTKRQLMLAAHYLMFMYETNIVLERSKQSGDYQSFLNNCKVQEFLAIKKESYDDNSYRLLRSKIARLGST